ncbi:MFS transporter [Salmonella enterica]|nr:MFS transporter [Salmonella enterica]
MNTNVYENTDSETITPLNKRRILPVFLLVGLYAASTAAVMSVLPFYIREMGGSPLIIGIIIATEAFSQFCAAPLIGHLSDRVGRKRILIVTLAIAAISLLLLANAQCILFILLARTLFGISAGNLSAAAAYIADCTHVRNRRQAIGILTGCTLVTYPRIIGHEVTGIVLQEGAGMPDNIKEGDRVIVDPYIYCGHCYPCSVGRTNCCENLNVIGVHVDGAMQEVVTHPAHLIHKIPDNVPSEMAPLAEPLTIALHALHRANVKAGEYVAIIGAGAIGLMAALSARHYKATPILIDIVEERLRYAQKLGVPYVLNAADDQVIDAIKNITHGTMAQVVIEASGANSAIRNTLDLASFAGRISFTGWPKQETSLPTNLITYKELDLRGSRTSAGEFDEALRMLSTLEINPQDVVSKVVNLDEIPDAVKELDRYPERYLKINAVFH